MSATTPFAEYTARLGRKLATALVTEEDQATLATQVSAIAAELAAAADNPGAVMVDDPLVNETVFANRDISPASSAQNPLAPPLELTYDGDVAVGRAVLPPQFTGPPNRVHGGAIAMLFDQTLGAVSAATGTPAFTRELTITYDDATQLDTPLEFRCWVDSIDGRKRWLKGEVRANGKVTARAKGLWIVPRDWETLFPGEAAEIAGTAANS